MSRGGTKRPKPGSARWLVEVRCLNCGRVQTNRRAATDDRPNSTCEVCAHDVAEYAWSA